MSDRRTTCWILLALAVVLWSLPAQADRFHVSPDGTRLSGTSDPGDWSAENCYATLGAAVVQGAVADSVLCVAGTHIVNGLVDLDVAFIGNQTLSADWSETTLDLGLTGWLNSAPGHVVLRLQGLTLVGGASQRDQPCLVADNIALEVEGCRFQSFDAASAPNSIGGGAMRLRGQGTVTVLDSEFTENHCPGRGGAIHIGSPYIIHFERCLIAGSTSLGGSDPRGGALHVDGRFGGSTATFLFCELRDNECGGSGGAATLRNCSVVWEDCLIIGNRSGLTNGYSEGSGLQHNRYNGDGGPIMTATARRCTFIDNKGAPDIDLNGGDGGGFYLVGSSDNIAQGLVEDCYFRDNFNIQGSGVYISRYAEGIIRRSQFVENTAYHMGGGAFKGGPGTANDGETLLIEQSLFLRNQAGYDVDGNPNNDYNRGGAICCRMHPRVIARNCTFVDNRCSQSSYFFGDSFAHYFEWGAWVPENLCVLENCVFWGENGLHYQVYSSDGGMEAIDNCAYVDGELRVGDFVPVDPVLLSAMPFEDVLTGYPAAGGPLIDAALDLGFTTDIDGDAMPIGDGPDIGCYEWRYVVAVDDAVPVATGLRVGPNPFNPRTVLSCRLPAPATVRLVLYDARGQQVRELWSGAVASGEHQWTWNGRDDTGRDCATGVYLARLVIDGRQASTHKLALVR